MASRKRPARCRPRKRSQRKKDAGTCFVCGGRIDPDAVAGVQGILADDEPRPNPAPDVVEVDIHGMGVSAVLIGPDSPSGRQGLHVLFLLCSAECAKVLRLLSLFDRMQAGEEPPPSATALYGLRLKRPGSPEPRLEDLEELLQRVEAVLQIAAPEALARIDAGDPPPPRAGPDPSPEERAWAERTLQDVCAWCKRDLADDPVRVLYVTFNETPARAGLVTIPIGPVLTPVLIGQPDEADPDSPIGAIVLCSAECAAAVRAAVREDRRLSTIH